LAELLKLNSTYFDDMISNWRMNAFSVPHHILILVLHGRLIYQINHERVIAEKGDLIYIPKGTLRGAESDEKIPHRKYSVLFNHTFPTGVVTLFDRNLFAKKKARNFEYVKQRFEALHREKLEEKPQYRFLSEGILQELVGLVSREMEAFEVSPTKWKLAEKIQNHLLERYRQPHDVNELAQLIQRSPNYTISLFKEAIGQTPVKYVQQLRIAEAQNLLLNTDMTVTEIADYLGFYDTSYFYRTFKKATSMSPSAFAEQSRFDGVSYKKS
jgi:AraC-like DNA-binding protein